jgi:hypothetical protein
MNYEALIIGEYILSRSKKRFEVIKNQAAEEAEKKIDWEYLPSVTQIASTVCKFFDVPVDELSKDRQLRYLVRIRRAITFLSVKLYDPESLGILKYQLYQKKIVDGLRRELGRVIFRTGPATSHMIRGAVNEYLTDKQVRYLYHYLENQLYQDYGNKTDV